MSTCTVCGDSYTDSETEATGHSWDEGALTTEATTTTDGVKTNTCTECGKTHMKVIAATGSAASGNSDSTESESSNSTVSTTSESETSASTLSDSSDATESSFGLTVAAQTSDNRNLWLREVLLVQKK